MKWKRGTKKNGEPDPYYIQTDGYTIARTGPDEDRVYMLWKADVRSAVLIAKRTARTDEEGRVAVCELKQICERGEA